MSSTCLVLSRDLVSVEVAARQAGAHPQTSLTRSTFPVLFPVLAPERPPDGKPTPNAEKEEACTRRAGADDGFTASHCGLSGTGS